VFRHLVGAIAALFILPIVEELLGLLLKDNVRYLPMSSLAEVNNHTTGSASAALLFTAYIAGAFLIAWYFFRRRDAN
jgi:hypothetical protein